MLENIIGVVQKLINDIFDWDTENWSKAIPFWEHHLQKSDSLSVKCLELGSNKGGLSLWLALNGKEVVCSDYENPSILASPLHEKYKVSDKVKYESIDALNIPYQNKFDCIVFKSILGGISRNGNDALKKKVIEEIYKAMKPGAMFLFAENLQGSFVHRFFRKTFVNWGRDWNYLSMAELPDLLSEFSEFHYIRIGFFGLLGRSENQRRWLGKLDAVLAPMIPKSCRYIVMVAAVK